MVKFQQHSLIRLLETHIPWYGITEITPHFNWQTHDGNNHSKDFDYDKDLGKFVKIKYSANLLLIDFIVH